MEEKLSIFPMYITMAGLIDLLFVLFVSWLVVEGMLWLFKAVLTAIIIIFKIGLSS